MARLKLSRRQKLKMLGNAVVWQQAFVILDEIAKGLRGETL